MAERAFLDSSNLVSPPGRNLVDLNMTILALDVIDKMGTGIMFGTLDLMTAVTGHRLCLNSGSLDGMLFDIRDIPVAAIARIGTMNRPRKLTFIHVLMAFETF